MDLFVRLFAGGLALGAIYGAIAIGFVLVFRATGVLNFAQGEFMAVGAFVGSTLTTTAGLSFLASAAAVLTGMGALGAALYLVVIRHFVGRSLFTNALVMVGVAMAVRAVVLWRYGSVGRPTLSTLPEGGFDIAGASVQWVSVVIIAVGALMVASFSVFFRRTQTGLQLQALTSDLHAAVGVGVRPHRLFAITWCVAIGFAGLAGLLYAHMAPTLDQSIASLGLRAFPAAVIGGINSLFGAMIGGLFVGLSEQFAAGYLGGEYRDLLGFGLMFIVLLIRPQGIFGTPEVSRV